MYILYTDGKFEYASEDSVLTYTPLQLSDNQSLAMYNGQISAVSVINKNAEMNLFMSNHYVLTIELSGIIAGPCTFLLRLSNHDMRYQILKNITFNGIQPFSLTIPIYNKMDLIFIIFYNGVGFHDTVNVRVTYI